MSGARSYPVIGVDGGGTHCRFAFARGGNSDDRVELRLGSANVSSDRAGTLATLRDGLDRLARKAGLDRAAFDDIPVFMGLAGVTGPEMARDLQDALQLGNVRVEDDRRTTLVGALGDRDGYVAGIGTGSFLGGRRNGAERLIGGWGFTLGDEASGAWLGHQCLRLVLQSRDGLVPATSLTTALLDEFGDGAGLVAFATGARPADFASLAPRIVSAAHAGDTVARGLMDRGAGYIDRALSELGREAGDPLCLVGGLAPQYAPYLPTDLARCLIEARGTALDGALALAGRIPRREAGR